MVKEGKVALSAKKGAKKEKPKKVENDDEPMVLCLRVRTTW